MLAKKAKRMLSLLLTLVMILGMLPTGAFATGSGTQENPMLNPEQQYFDELGNPVTKDDNWAVSMNKTVSQENCAENEFQIDLEVISKKNIAETSNVKPVRVVLVMDTSYSMGTQANGRSYLDYAKDAANQFVDQLMAEDMPDGCGVSVVDFSDTAKVKAVDLFSLTDREEIKSRAHSFIGGMWQGSGTFTQAGLRKAWEMLNADRARLDDPNDEKADRLIILLSDGLPTRSYQALKVVEAGDDFNYYQPPVDGDMSKAQKYTHRITEFNKGYTVKSEQWYFNDYKDSVLVSQVMKEVVSWNVETRDDYTVDGYTLTEHMLPTISEAYNIRQDGYEIYTVYVGNAETTDFMGKFDSYGKYKVVLNGTWVKVSPVISPENTIACSSYVMESLVNDPATQATSTSDPAQLEQMYSSILNKIVTDVSVWEVTDPMSDYVTFEGLIGGDKENVQISDDGRSFLWQVWNETGVEQPDGTYKYTLSYKVKVDNIGHAMTAGQAIYDTNDPTTLTYYMGEEPPASQDDVLKATFDVPKVGVYSGSFSFTKADKNNPDAQFGYTSAARSGELQNVATFTLTHAADCACGKGDGSTVVKTASTINNTVTFTDIPSGHSYTMTETVPAGYDQSKAEEYTVTVAWGEVSVTDSSGAPVKLDGFTIYNELDPKDQELTVNKSWLGGQPADDVVVTVNVTGTNQSGETVVEETIILDKASGWTGSVTVPTVDVATGETITYAVDEQPVEGWKLVNSQQGEGLSFALTNARSQQVTYSVEKNWVGPQADWKDVTAKLMKNGTEPVATVTLNGANDWSASFGTVDAYDDAGQPITYTVVEVIDGQEVTNNGTFTVNGHSYNAAVSNSGDKFTITNTIAQDETVSVAGTKTWKAAALTGDEDVKATFELYADDQATGKTVVLGLKDSSISFTDLPKYALNGTSVGDVAYGADADGHTIAYTIVEVEVTGLTGGDFFTQTDDGNNNFTNTLTGTTEVTVTKVWMDDDNAEGLRPTSITFKLMNGETEVDSVTLSATHHDAEVGQEGEELAPAYDEWTAENLTHTFTDLPKYDANGALIQYTVVEETVDKYGNPKYEQEGNNWTVTNTLEPGETSITVTKVWVDAAASHEEIDIEILANGAPSGQFATLNEGNKWTAVVEGLPLRDDQGKLIEYTLSESNVPEGYTATVVKNAAYQFTVYNVIDQAETSVTADKVWVEGDEASRPELTFTLYADGVDTGKVIRSSDEGYDPTNITFSGLEKYKYVEQDGQKVSCTEIKYTIQETMDGPLADRYTSQVSVDPETGVFHFTNTFSPGSTKVEGKKVWVDGGKQSHSPVTVGVFEVDEHGTVLKETPVKTTTTTGSYVFDGLEAYGTDGSTKHYAVYEMDGGVRVEHGGTIVIDGETYVVSYGTGTITNTLEQELISIPVTKVWQGPAVEEVTFTLTREGDPGFSQTLTLTEANAQPDGTWKGTFEDLEKYDADRNTYKYTVTENEVPGYTTSQVGNVFTNTVEQVEDASLTVVKVWEMLPGSDEPASVQIQLYADGQPYNGSIEAYKNPVDISAEGGWTYTFENLPRYAYTTDGDGAVTSVKEIVYTAQEVGATLSGEQYVITIDHDHFNVDYTTRDDGAFVITNDHISTDIFSYQVIRNYTTYIDGVAQPTETETGEVVVGTEGEEIVVNPDDYKNYNGNGYDFLDGTIDGVKPEGGFTFTLEQVNHTYVVVLNYERRVVTAKYDVTVNYYDLNGNKIGETYVSPEILEGGDWDVTDKQLSTITKDGVLYHFHHANGDPLKGSNIDRDKVIDLYYAPQSPDTVTITVNKVWQPATVAPVDVTVDLWRVVGDKDAVAGEGDDVKAGSVTIRAGETSATLELPATNVGDGSSYTYYAVESAPASGYIVSYSPETIVPKNEDQRTITVTNQVDPQNVEITVEKVWLPNNPNVEVTVQLWQQVGQKDAVPGEGDDVLAGTVTIPAGGASGKATLPTYDVKTGAKCVYYAVETKPDSGYAVHYAPASITPANSSERKITVTNVDQGSDSITVSKSWDTVAGFDTTATLVLLRDGTIVESVELTGNNSHSFTGLPLRDPNGQAYTYTVAEWGGDTDGDKQIDLNELVYDGGSVTVDGHKYAVTIDGLNVTNTFVPGTIDISGVKKWVDGNDAAGLRPDEITVVLLKNAVETGKTQTVTGPDWKFSFTNLPEYEKVEGAWTRNVYSVTDSVPGYTTTNGAPANGYTLTNTISQGKVSVSVEKIWNDADAGTRPDSISIQLYRNGVAVDGKVVTFAKTEGTWAQELKHTFTNLDQYDADGAAYVYTVKEVDVDDAGNLVVGGKDTGYDCTISADTDNSSNFSYTVTNTINGGSTSVTVTKYWVDVNATEQSRPDVTIVLTGSDGSEYTCQFTGANANETHTFENLPLYKDGKLITYTAKETGLDGTAYTGQQKDFSFYNYLTETNDFTLSGSKSWVDNGVDRPASVTIVLQSDAA
ncbi:Cna B-type domain-containing protein, partial [uncultured Flavonifractor sp.]|uniref:Cna B-type domain-containing protein n=1 Tax=uncultured Flavonifractor sp. TaxID=1193534 RepID=UPI002635F478